MSTDAQVPLVVAEALAQVSTSFSMCPRVRGFLRLLRRARNYYFVIFGALSLHAAFLECLVFACDSPSILFSHTFWMTILLSFWEPCSYIRLSSRAISLCVALQPFLSARFRTWRLCFHRTIPLAVSCPPCWLLRMGPCIQSSDF